ncbi:hypothetical protein NP511_01220 [Natrinema thermotolerans]|uniref:DUF7115 domain-containing protein n=1 Tax=Natrinema thermotolerans TaxID=121872 RepID=A0AAF0PEB9_9EURY|nr:hypothetical protein [Natrinema thermotolerans]QCC60596.1 hypothetical protein DVR14_18925 [Natrinema thermotolerans]QCC61483.1 hypothetical protein DVR14_23060 [Natrinema thermotolerans]WMT07640.1 hypothetical protein NP511_19935 [Natrinema thermotolerans]WMT08272.1 hypothetical protein NP511_01220 [Natrinema thermotolerans]
MSVPGIVDASLDGEEIAARVSLGSDDELFITPTRTIVYRADGLLSDESADEYPHDADRLTISEGRRKTKFALEYALEGEREFAVPAKKTDDVLHPVLAGVLNGNGITDPGETVVKTYRFSELTLIVTSDRLVKHIGGAVWDGDYEEYRFEDVTNLTFEDGSVATQIVLTVDGRPQRIKAPNEEANDLRERLQRALFDYHDVESLEEFNLTVGDDEDEAATDEGSMDFGGGVDPLDADPPEPEDRETAGTGDAGGTGSADPLADGAADDAAASGSASTGAAAGSGSAAQSATRGATGDGRVDAGSSEQSRAETGSVFESASDAESAAEATGQTQRPPTETDPELLERIESLEAAVERQSEIIERQEETIEQLIAELRQGR